MSPEPVSPPWPDQLGKGETQKRLLAMKVSELKSIAQYEGIKTGPTKRDTVDRIMHVWFDKARPDFPPAPAAPTPPPAGPPPAGPTPMGNVVYPAPSPVSAEPISAAPVAVASPSSVELAPVTAAVPSSPSLSEIIKPEVALKPPFSAPFDRRAIKKALRGMSLEGVRAIADLEGIEHSSSHGILDKYEVIVLILDAWQRRALEQISRGEPPVVVPAGRPQVGVPVMDGGVPQVSPSSVVVVPTPAPEAEPAPQPVRMPVVEAPPASETSPGERDAENSWPLELGRVETLKRLKAMTVRELEAIAENEGVEVGPKKSDTIDRILKAWFTHRTATRYQGRARPEEPPPGMSARAKRIRETGSRR